MHKTKHKYWKVKDVSYPKKFICTPVLAFFYFSTSLGLFWTLVQVLLHTKLVHFTINGPVSLLGECVRTV
jgi:hypothetical protein